MQRPASIVLTGAGFFFGGGGVEMGEGKVTNL